MKWLWKTYRLGYGENYLEMNGILWVVFTVAIVVVSVLRLKGM